METCNPTRESIYHPGQFPQTPPPRTFRVKNPLRKTFLRNKLNGHSTHTEFLPQTLPREKFSRRKCPKQTPRQWLKCNGTQGNAVPPPPIFASKRSPTSDCYNARERHTSIVGDPNLNVAFPHLWLCTLTTAPPPDTSAGYSPHKIPDRNSLPLRNYPNVRRAPQPMGCC